MCLIAHRTVPKGKKGGSNIPNEVIDYNRQRNPDGFGLAWRDKTGLHHEKFGPNQFHPFRDLLKDIDRQTGVEYAAHFRMATHGPACLDLSHPFSYRDPKAGDVLVFHNGIIDIDTKRGESDTSAFVSRVLARMEPRWWDNSAYRYLVEGAIGWSRLLVMTNEESVRLNQSAWYKMSGIWYSTTPLPIGPTKPTPGIVPTVRAVTKYVPPVEWRGDWDEDEDEEDDLVTMAEAAASPSLGWYSNGHHVSPVSDMADDMGDEGDRYGTAVCDQCRTTGEFYVIEGKVYLDVPHGQRDEVHAQPLGT